MAAPRRKKRNQMCSECGAELMAGSAHCPLCGAEHRGGHPGVAPPAVTKPDPAAEVENYQADLRRLREQLDAIRARAGEAS